MIGRRTTATLATILVGIGVAGCGDDPPTPTAPSAPGSHLASPAPDMRGAPANIGVNVVFTSEPTAETWNRLEEFGPIQSRFPQIRGAKMRASASDLVAIRGLPFVASAEPDVPRVLNRPVDAVPISDFAAGGSTWNLDAVNVVEFGVADRVAYDGEGVYVGIIDTGLLHTWRYYLPDDRIASEHARALAGGGVAGIHVSDQPNKWEHDTYSHGTHVASTVIGFRFFNFGMNGVAPKAKVIPIRIQQGAGWSSIITAAVLYLADLKAGLLSDHPVVANLSLGGFGQSALEQAAIDYAIAQGVILVASAGNSGERGMVYPAAYEPVISVAATGWVFEFTDCGSGTIQWWWSCDVSDPTDPAEHFVAPFSSRELPGQHLDLAAPGARVVGPWQLDSGHTSYFFVSGTSMSSPHVAGVVALMAQKKPDITAGEAEAILESTATPLPAWGAEAVGSGLLNAEAALGAIP